MSSHYVSLGVPRNASKDVIKKAYRQLAKKYHPDVNNTRAAQLMFQKVQGAYDTLSDEKKRREYDETHNFDTLSGSRKRRHAKATSNMDCNAAGMASKYRGDFTDTWMDPSQARNRSINEEFAAKMRAKREFYQKHGDGKYHYVGGVYDNDEEYSSSYSSTASMTEEQRIKMQARLRRNTRIIHVLESLPLCGTFLSRVATRALQERPPDNAAREKEDDRKFRSNVLKSVLHVAPFALVPVGIIGFVFFAMVDHSLTGFGKRSKEINRTKIMYDEQGNAFVRNAQGEWGKLAEISMRD